MSTRQQAILNKEREDALATNIEGGNVAQQTNNNVVAVRTSDRAKRAPARFEGGATIATTRTRGGQTKAPAAQPTQRGTNNNTANEDTLSGEEEDPGSNRDGTNDDSLATHTADTNQSESTERPTQEDNRGQNGNPGDPSDDDDDDDDDDGDGNNNRGGNGISSEESARRMRARVAYLKELNAWVSQRYEELTIAVQQGVCVDYQDYTDLTQLFFVDLVRGELVPQGAIAEAFPNKRIINHIMKKLEAVFQLLTVSELKVVDAGAPWDLYESSRLRQLLEASVARLYLLMHEKALRIGWYDNTSSIALIDQMQTSLTKVQNVTKQPSEKRDNNQQRLIASLNQAKKAITDQVTAACKAAKTRSVAEFSLACSNAIETQCTSFQLQQMLPEGADIELVKTDIARASITNLNDDDCDDDLRRVKRVIIAKKQGEASLPKPTQPSEMVMEPYSNLTEWFKWVQLGASELTLQTAVLKVSALLNNTIDVSSTHPLDAKKDLTLLLKACDEMLQQLHMHPLAYKNGGGKTMSGTLNKLLQQLPEGTVIFDYEKIGCAVIKAYKLQMGWDSNTVISLEREFVKELKGTKIEIGKPFYRFWKAIQSDDDNYQALWFNYQEGLIPQLLGGVLNDLFEKYFKAKSQERSERMAKSRAVAVHNVDIEADDGESDDEWHTNASGAYEVTAQVNALANDFRLAMVALEGSKSVNVLEELGVIGAERMVNQIALNTFDIEHLINAVSYAEGNLNPVKCFRCFKDHPLRECPEFKKELEAIVQTLQKLLNPLRQGEDGERAVRSALFLLRNQIPDLNMAQGRNERFGNKTKRNYGGRGA
jgi:phosphoribosyl-dephospho-CoA transferase